MSQIHVGYHLDACDYRGNWCAAKVVDTRAGEVLVNFSGWDNKWDEWIDIDHKRLAALGIHSGLPYVSVPDSSSAYTSIFVDSQVTKFKESIHWNHFLIQLGLADDTDVLCIRHIDTSHTDTSLLLAVRKRDKLSSGELGIGQMSFLRVISADAIVVMNYQGQVSFVISTFS